MMNEEIYKAMEVIAGESDASFYDIIDCLTGTCFDQEAAGEMEERRSSRET